MFKEINSKIIQEIPMARHMGYSISELNVKLAKTFLPLAPNVNHLGTGFGGSLYAFGALTCYSVVLCNLSTLGIENPYVVIADGHIDYLKAARGDMSSSVEVPDQEHVEFLEAFQAKGVAKLKLEAKIISAGHVCAKFKGNYVVKRTRR